MFIKIAQYNILYLECTKRDDNLRSLNARVYLSESIIHITNIEGGVIAIRIIK